MQPVKRFWKRLRPHLAAVLLVALAVVTLREPITWWLQGEENYDRQALKEWLLEAKVYETLPELVGSYLSLHRRHQQLEAIDRAGGRKADEVRDELKDLQGIRAPKREEIEVHLKALAEPLTQMYQLPLFPVIYRLAVEFDKELGLEPIAWDSGKPRQAGQYRELNRLPLQ